MPCCCVVSCANTFDNTTGVSFYAFPSRPWDQERRKKWIRAVKRKNPDGTPWQPTKSSRVCSVHFVGGKMSNVARDPSYVPTIFPEVYKKRKLKEGAVTRSDPAIKREIDQKSCNLPKIEQMSCNLPSTSAPGFDEAVLEPNPCTSCSVSTQASFDFDSSIFCFEASRQEDGFITQCTISHGSDVSSAETKDTGLGTENNLNECEKGFHGFASVRDRENCLKYLTTTSFETFSYLLTLLEKKSFRPLSDPDALLLFLMKMKLGLSFSCLGVFFNVNRTTATRVFLAILKTLAMKTLKFIHWPSKCTIRQMLPDSFKKDFAETRVIIDCTELKTEMPCRVDDPVSMDSHYKSAYTLKFVIGITPHGSISFLSKCYGGRKSDSQITEGCGLLELLEKGDIVLAAKSFPGVHTDADTIVVMPPVVHDGGHTAEEVANPQSIAEVRIHVERCIQRVKIYQILSFIPHSLFNYVDHIVQVASVLANFLPPILECVEDEP